jgi:hypothetical protein
MGGCNAAAEQTLSVSGSGAAAPPEQKFSRLTLTAMVVGCASRSWRARVVQTGDERLSLRVSGAYDSELDILKINFAVGDRTVRLGDLAEVRLAGDRGRQSGHRRPDGVSSVIETGEVIARYRDDRHIRVA